MLKLENINKIYKTRAASVCALQDISVSFRSSEFVAILGHSGSGKTTLLNIIGGLDHCTSGKIFIQGRDTGRFHSKDWDAYRNHSVGFIFQAYHLIPHRTVFENVELALTLCGISRRERHRRTEEMLIRVGLADQMHKKPNQLSGGQMQRVAIARALINDPEIILADEPTGSLDSEASVQIMDLLKEIARERLVIMVTHNSELAAAYASRTIVLKHGVILSDSNPYESEPCHRPKSRRKHTFLSPLTAFSLSLSNLIAKKWRTLLTAFAGSIGIIGIAIILSLAASVNDFLYQTEKNLLSSYPLTITTYTSDLSALFSPRDGADNPSVEGSGIITTANTINGMLGLLADGAVFNDLAAFKAYIESGSSGLETLTTDIRYSYSTDLYVYREQADSSYIQINPNTTFSSVRNVITKFAGDDLADQYDIFQQVASDPILLEAQYQLLAGKFPSRWNELVLVLNSNGQISDFTLYSLNVLDRAEVSESMTAISEGKEVKIDNSALTYTYDDFLGMTFKVIPTPDHFILKKDGTWRDARGSHDVIDQLAPDAEELVIVGVIQPLPDATDYNPNGIVGYTSDLMEHLIEQISTSEAILAQKADPTINIFTGKPFEADSRQSYTLPELEAMIPSFNAETQASFQETIAQMRAEGSADEEIAAVLSEMVPETETVTYEDNLAILGDCHLDTPKSIDLYPMDLEAKEQIKACIRQYNAGRDKSQQIVYTDYVGILLESLTMIVDSISYVIIAFVAISLIVSSIMIGIITNISVLERTGEIGILRAVGASRMDIALVFNAESILVGLSAGLVGIGVTELLLCWINHLIGELTTLSFSVSLETDTALFLIVISAFLTFLAGLFPAHRASRKDPIVALRSE